VWLASRYFLPGGIRKGGGNDSRPVGRGVSFTAVGTGGGGGPRRLELRVLVGRDLTEQPGRRHRGCMLALVHDVATWPIHDARPRAPQPPPQQTIHHTTHTQPPTTPPPQPESDRRNRKRTPGWGCGSPDGACDAAVAGAGRRLSMLITRDSDADREQSFAGRPRPFRRANTHG